VSLTLNTNTNSLNTQRRATEHSATLARAIGRLSSGLRINSAADDAAGLAITQRMSAGINGGNQAVRNINDASSMVQVADSAMAQVTDSLQRLRALAVQAGNGSYGASDREALQGEAGQILRQITQIGEQTSFNGQAVFAQDTASLGGDDKKRRVIDGLKTGWLTSAEKLIKQYYGLEGDGATITVNLDTTDGAFNVLASVSGSVSGGSGKFNNIHLNIDMADFGTGTTPDGGTNPMFYSDRVIAHEMVHAVMSRSTDFQFPQWFTEGTAELIQGADERLAGAIAGGAPAVAAVVNSVGGGFTYEGAYAASRYLHEKLKEMGVAGGIKGVMQYLTQNQSASLDQALNAVTNGAYASTSAFVADFTANGANYITTQMNLTNADTGAIGGLDADGGPSRNARDVVSDVSDRSADAPLEGFNVVFPDLGGSTGMRHVQVQAGANAGDVINLSFGAMNAHALGLADLDLSDSAVALLHIDQALEFVNKQRVATGASNERLELAAQGLTQNVENLSAARSRIQDTDFAVETTALTRAQILQQAATAILSQANSQPQMVLQLLR
jgi:flagellin